MSDRPTPETDAFAVKFKSICGSKAWVPTDICRRLERERDEAREERDIARLEFEEISNERYEEIQKVRKERDEAREALAEAWRFADQWLALADGYLKRINEIQNDIQKN